MRGLKAKTLRRAAAKSTLPVDNDYRAKRHAVVVHNPDAGKPGQPDFLTVTRLQAVLGPCRRGAYRRMKRACPKGQFFSFALREYRDLFFFSKPTIQVVEAAQ